MGKLVRVLVVLCLLLSIGALVLGMMLFGKRELLKGRAQKLETAIIQLGTVIEAEAPTAGGAAQNPERDLSPATLEYIDQQDYSSFWTTYSNAYESIDAATLNLAKRDIELMTYYKRNNDGEILKDARGLPVTSGEGTMQGVLDDLQGRAEAQYNLLNDTRQQLATTRSELVTTIQDLNQTKSGYRLALQKVLTLEANVSSLTADLRQARDQISGLNEEKRALQDRVAEERSQVRFLEEQKDELEGTLVLRDEEIARLRGKKLGGPTTQVNPTGNDDALITNPGDKGTIVAINPTWNFVVLSLSEAALVEFSPRDPDAPQPAVELMVRRRNINGKDTFVTKIRIQKIRQDKKLAIASILTDWQQMDVQEGDIVFK